MTLLLQDDNTEVVYYLQGSGIEKAVKTGEMAERVTVLFNLESYTPYRTALFLSFLYYFAGRVDRLQALLHRLDAIDTGNGVPSDSEEFLNTWFDGAVPEQPQELLQRFRAEYNAREAGYLKQAEEKLRNLAADFTDEAKKRFELFYEKTAGELFLREMEIHSEELNDTVLQQKALRWEYKYLGHDRSLVEKRRKIFLERQQEWLKPD